MAKKGYTPEQIINKLREAEILLSQRETIAVISKKIGVSAHTYYPLAKRVWRHESRPGEETERVRAGEHPFKEAGSRSISR
jgi:hypothetical protein